MPETSPNLGLQAPLGNEPVSQGDDLMRANNVILDGTISDLQSICHMEGGGAAVPASVTTQLTGYTTTYGQTAWADAAAGTITVPVAGVYHVAAKLRMVAIGQGGTHNVNGSIRDSAGGFSSQWFLAVTDSLGNLTVTSSLYTHMPAGHAIWQAAFITGLTADATVELGHLSVRLALPD